MTRALVEALEAGLAALEMTVLVLAVAVAVYAAVRLAARAARGRW